MERMNVRRLLHSLVPFLTMLLVQRALTLAADRLSLNGALTETAIFLLSAAAGFALLRSGLFAVPEGETPLEVPPLSPETPAVCLLAVPAAVAGMILFGYLSAALFVGEEGLDLSPLGIVSLLLVHPLVEEYLFRWCIYRNLREMSPIFGCLAQAVMFALLQNSVAGMIGALTGGVILAFTVEETGVLGSAVAAHILTKLRTVLWAGALAEYPEIRRRIDIVLYLAGVAAAAGVLFIRSRRLRRAAESAEADEFPDFPEPEESTEPDESPESEDESAEPANVGGGGKKL